MHNNNNINNEMFDLNYIINNNYYERINILNFLSVPRIVYLLIQNENNINNKDENEKKITYDKLKYIIFIVPNKTCYINGKDEYSLKFIDCSNVENNFLIDIKRLKSININKNFPQNFEIKYEEYFNGELNINSHLIETSSKEMSENYVKSLNAFIESVDINNNNNEELNENKELKSKLELNLFNL
jgi:hypothetical protein